MTIELSQSSSPVPNAMQPSLVLPRPALPARPCYGAACRPSLLAIVFAAVHCSDASEEIHGNKWRHPYDMYSDTDVFLTDVPRLRSLRLSSPPFRLGSGAWLSPTTASPAEREHASALPRGDDPRRNSFDADFYLPSRFTLPLWIPSMATLLAIFSLVFCMMPGRNRIAYDRRVPPGWDPADERTYSFRAWITDIGLWTYVTDMSPPQQAAAIVLVLGGSAREYARTLPPAQLLQGGIINGQQVDPVSFLLASLRTRYGALEEESRLAAITELMGFADQEKVSPPCSPDMR